MKKRCPKCGEEKELTEFYKHSQTISGYNSACKKCSLKSGKTWAKNNVSKVRMIQDRYYKLNHEKIKESAALWAKENPLRIREIEHLYRINPEVKRRRNLSNKRNLNKLTEGAVKGLLVAHKQFKREDITPDLIKLKRQQITMKRILKQFKQFRKEKENESNSTNV